MLSFWSGFTKDASAEDMMLDTNASSLQREELPEVLSLLPEYKGQRILELAGGIGRFTGILADQAAHVTTVDFIAEFIEKNKDKNKKRGNIQFIADDAMNLSFPEKSFDIIFTNWFLMYLSSEDMAMIKQRMLMWLKDGGYFFCRESCNVASGNYDIEYNPTYYRSPQEYHDLLMGTKGKIECQQSDWDFNIVFVKSLQSYAKLKQNRNQMCWLLQKCKQDYGREISVDPRQTLKCKLDSKKTISQLERLLGDDYNTFLGHHFIETQFEKLNVKPGQNVLDLACGTGSADFHIEEFYSADVVGVDSSCDKIEVAWERISQLKSEIKICFEIGDVTKSVYPPEHFDVIYSGRESMHIHKKQSLLKNIMTWLKPGGKFGFYEFSEGNNSQDSEDNYLQNLKSGGFIDVSTTDVSQHLINKLTDGKKNISEKRPELTVIFTDDELKLLEDDWSKTITCLEDGDKKWSWFDGQKPSGM
ncbi:putative phosphomethylethanolamine N-methyltransferase-like [Apostichopus japonicus]|uniref:phosphoethanolamine N-methyltransferase n=2 Tax=Stichopus japonicus TaxID=307972 RepID=A0A2G8LFK4_STIJA|nr:putative phosphomethylethanolamine N-methyltransferase-like [Apostichopus japonicus]